MNRGVWQTTVHGITRVRHDLVTKPPSPTCSLYLWGFPGVSVGWDYPLEEGMAESPWTEEPGGLQSMGSQRVRHD